MKNMPGGALWPGAGGAAAPAAAAAGSSRPPELLPGNPGWSKPSEEEIQRKVNMAVCRTMCDLNGLKPIPPGFCEALADGKRDILRAVLDEVWPELIRRKREREAIAAAQAQAAALRDDPWGSGATPAGRRGR
eukprot:tig00000492_g1443.t1